MKTLRFGFSTLSAACAVLALKGYSASVSQSGVQLGVEEILANQKTRSLDATGDLLKQVEFSPEAAALRFTASTTPLGAYCQAVEAGYERELPTKAVSNGLEVYREFPTTVKVGQPITVRICVRALDKGVSNTAIVDLLPGGFEVVADSLEPGAGALGWDFVEVREDRVVLFGDVGTSVRVIEYQIKATSAGTFTVPPAFVESMYERGVHGTSVAGQIVVTAR